MSVKQTKSIERQYEEAARAFCEAIRQIAEKPDSIDNLESYLSIHFGTWLEKWANSPEGIAAEMKHFANIEP